MGRSASEARHDTHPHSPWRASGGAIEALGITGAQLARDIQAPAKRVTGIPHGTRGITADTALRLGRYFGTSAEFWMNLQQMYDLRVAERDIGKAIKAIPRGRTRKAAQLPRPRQRM